MRTMLISEFDYELPDRLVAQEPLENRSASRMLFVDRSTSRVDDETFAAFPEHLREGDVVVLNNTKVFPARLIGRSATGAKVELFLIRPLKDGNWETLARPARRLKTGKRIDFGPQLSAEVLSRNDEGRLTVRPS
ncbi:MAG: S-adenosylmethionine:tRNA ribosyltransferase-isomerase, partial [Acidobacteriota bacterium]